MALEGHEQRVIWLALGGICRLFRLNTGRGWLSNTGPKGVSRLKDGSVLIESARPIALGFSMPNGEPVVGASDLHGWTSVVVTADMVGQRLAVYTSIECKRSKGGKATAEQLNWIKQVENAGGIAGVAASSEQALGIVNGWMDKFKQKRLL